MADSTHVVALRATWRKSAEHKAAQLKRFTAALGAVLAAQVVSDLSAGKNPLTHFTDLRTSWYYLLPFALIAWRQIHPAMTASQADSAPGVTVVPEQVGLEPTPPAAQVTADTNLDVTLAPVEDGPVSLDDIPADINA